MSRKDVNSCHVSSLHGNPRSSGPLFALVLLVAAISAPVLREVLAYLFPQVSWVVFDSLHALFSVIVLAPICYYFLFNPWKKLVSSYRSLADELQAAQTFSTGLLDSLAAHIAVVDKKGRILSVNESWRRFARKNPPVVDNVNEGADYFAVCRVAKAQGDEIARSMLEGLESIFSGEREHFFIEYPCHSPDTQRWFLCKARAFQNQNKTLIAITHVDITQRKLAEESVNQSEHLYRTLFATTGNATLIVEPDDTIALVNQEFENLCGYPRDEIEGRKKWTEFVTPESLAALPRLPPPEPGDFPRGRRNYEISFVTRTGETGCALAFVNDVSHEGRKIVSLTDITLRRRMEQELAGHRQQLLEQNQELACAYEELQQTQMRILQQEKMASIGQLAAGVAHEINNPIGFISSNLGSLKKYAQRIHDFLVEVDALDVVDEQTKNALHHCRKSNKIDFILQDLHDLIDESQEGSRRVARIVQDLKSFARIDDQYVQPVDLTDCLEKTLNIVWNEIKYKAEVVREYGALPPVTCRAQQINQVFMNLLINAVQAIEKQGTITLKTWADEAFAYVSVADTGSGIAPESIERVFEPFFTTKEAGRGTGLGLSITYDIVKKHDGDISVESRLGEGTVFSVKLPLQATVEEGA